MSDRSAATPQRRYVAALGAAVVLCALFTALLTSSLPASTRSAISAAAMLLGGVAVVVSGTLPALRTDGARRRAWLLLVSAAGIAMISNAVTFALGIDPVTNPTLLSEGSLVVAMVLSVFGVLGLPAVRQRGARLALLVLDGLVMGLAVLIIVSLTVYSQIIDDATSLTARAVTLVIPLLDVALATVALLLLVRGQGNRSFFSVVAIGFIMYAVADLAFAVEAAQGEFAFGSLIDMGWIAGYLLLAAAAWHPDATSVPDKADAQATYDLQGTLLVFGILVGAVAVQLINPQASLSRTQVVLWVLLVFAVAARQSLLTADNGALRQGLEQRVREQTADLRRLARQTEVLLSSVGDGIYGVDLDGRITFVNPSAAKALGHPPDEMLGMSAHEEFHGPQEDGTSFTWDGCYVNEAIQQGRVTSAEEDVYVRADGTTLPVEITASPLLDGDRISGAVVVFRDVTQRQEVDRMKNEFLSVVSHELRTPLTSIRGSLGLLSGGAMVDLTPQAERMVSIALDSSERLTRLINDILDIERIQSGKLPMSLAPQDVAALLRATETEMRAQASAADVRVEVAPCTARVLVDADRVVQTLTNLVGNAIKYTPPGGVVRVVAIADEHLVTIAVQDHGRGIPEDKLETVFEPFEQVDSSDARQKGGTGLGLSISRGIVERHGGSIWAESQLGAGTTVRFTLPRVQEDELAGTTKGDEPEYAAHSGS